MELSARTPRRRPEAPSAPTTLTEIARRYYTCAVALSKAMGLPLTGMFVREHRESISCCFIEAGRAGVRLPEGVRLPPLGIAAETSIITTPPLNGLGGPPPRSPQERGRPPASTTERCPHPWTIPGGGGRPHTADFHRRPGAPPLTIPAGLPCAGQTIATLKPALLRMLLSKVDQLGARAGGTQWLPLLEPWRPNARPPAAWSASSSSSAKVGWRCALAAAAGGLRPMPPPCLSGGQARRRRCRWCRKYMLRKP